MGFEQTTQRSLRLDLYQNAAEAPVNGIVFKTRMKNKMGKRDCGDLLCYQAIN